MDYISTAKPRSCYTVGVYSYDPGPPFLHKNAHDPAEIGRERGRDEGEAVPDAAHQDEVAPELPERTVIDQTIPLEGA